MRRISVLRQAKLQVQGLSTAGAVEKGEVVSRLLEAAGGGSSGHTCSICCEVRHRESANPPALPSREGRCHSRSSLRGAHMLGMGSEL